MDADEGERLKVRVSFTDDAGHEESLTSAATDAVAAVLNTPAAGAPAIGGTAQVGEELTASTSGISDADGLDNASFGYQWIRTDTDIEGATGSTYTAVDADEGKRLKVRVSFTDDAGHEESLTSAATDAVAAAPKPLTASFGGMPAEHGGRGSFSFQVAFSDGINISYTTVRDASFTVTGGDVTKARRVDKRRDLWKITGLRLAGRGEKIHENVCRYDEHVPIREVWRARRATAATLRILGLSGTRGTCGASNASSGTRRS